MRYRGRHIDPVALWEKYVEFPSNMKVDGDDQYLPKVVCPNPEHDTNKRHFQVNARDGLVHCFAHCGISGTFTHAIALIEGCEEREARKIILQHQRSGSAAIVIRKKTGVERPKVVKASLLRYEKFIPQVGLEYLDSRGITERAIAEWNIGWDLSEKRIVIPAQDETGVVRFLIKRSLKKHDNWKYLYYPEKSVTGWGKTDILFGACGIDLGMIRSFGLILVEGSLDVIKLSEFGYRNVGGILGTGISEQQRRIIARMRPRRIYFMFDKDVAGITNIQLAAQSLCKYPTFVCRFPKGVDDPAKIRNRGEAVRILERSIPTMRFMADTGLLQGPNAIRRKGKITTSGY